MQLQNAKAKFEQQGLKLAAISYDSQAILTDFAKRHKIEFPLLADPDSKVIRSFNVLNTEAKGMNKGMAHPGFFYIDNSGVIRDFRTGKVPVGYYFVAPGKEPYMEQAVMTDLDILDVAREQFQLRIPGP